jgi:hypothetical protein
MPRPLRPAHCPRCAESVVRQKSRSTDRRTLAELMVPDEGRDPIEPQVEFLNRLVDAGAVVDGDVVEITSETWAIHGQVPVDGEVIMAEFDSLDGARTALEKLAPPDEPG